jgi:hypothetical protein
MKMPARTLVSPADLRSAWTPDNQNFEAIFRIRATHRLLVARWRNRGGLWSAVYWEDEESGRGQDRPIRKLC